MTALALRDSESRPSRARAKPLPRQQHYTVADLPEIAPKHCYHCHALGAQDWWIWLWPENNACVAKTRVPYRCRSWRCPVCRTHEAHVSWTRMRDAFEPLDSKGMCFLVLTLDRCGTYSGEKRWPDVKSAYKDLSKLSTALMWRLRRWMKKQGWTPLGNQWVATVEMHRNGWPHVNIVLWSPKLAQWIEDERKAKIDDHISEDDARFVSRELADIVTESGWGLLSTAERARSRDQALGYITKVSGKADESIGELSKLTQLPTKAPLRFRRLRAGKGFLAPRNKSRVLTGTLIRRQNSNDGTRDAVPLHACPEPAIKPSEECCQTEERIWYAELEALERCKRQVKQFGLAAIRLPPVTHWFRFNRLAQGPPRRHHANDYLFRPEQVLQQSTA